MKKQYFMLLSFWIGLATTLHAEDFNMPTSYGDHADKVVTTPFVFYDSGGASGNAEAAEMDYTTYEVTNVYSGINLKAAKVGNQITLSFTSVNIVRGDYIKIYDRALTDDEKSNEWNTPSDDATWTISDSSTPITVTSTTGVLGVVYFEKQCTNANNWEAQVHSFTPAPMQFTSCTTTQENLSYPFLGKEHQPLLRIHVATTGALTPLSLSSLSYDLAGTSDLSDLTALQLYYTGNSTTFSADKLVEEKSTVTSSGQFTTSYTLADGDNYFWIAADVSCDAIAGHLLDAGCSALQVDNVVQTPSLSSPDGALSIKNEVLMSTSPKTYSVGQEAISFYDDGGKDQKITEKFEGKVVFLPTTVGSKVQVDFTKLSLFNTSSTGNNDVLKVYYGTEVNENQLAATFLKTLGKVQSIAADGALTITLKSVAGLPKDGFEATVSQFVPQAMGVETTAVTMPSQENVSSNTSEVQMLCFAIQTTGTEPALTLDQLKLNVPCYANLKNVKAYYTANDATFSSTIPLATQAFPGQANLVLDTQHRVLTQGNNYIWITFDIKENQPSGTTLDAALTSYTLSGNETTLADGNPAGHRTIENTWISRLGTSECNISGTWSFTHEENPYSPNKYKGVEGDQIITFKPANPGEVVQISFSDFEVKYSSSSYYGTRAKFEIRNGEVSGDILWAVDSSEKAKNGPQTLIRSTAADGALTILFDAKATASYYCAAGWHAQVQAYKATNMALESYTAFQENTDIMMTGAKAQEILGIKVTMQGTLNPVQATALKFDTKGNKAQLAGAKVYYTGSTKAFNSAADAMVGSVSVLQDQTTIAFGNKAETLAEGDNYFWIAYDLPDTGASEITYDAALVSMTIAGDDSTAPIVADPEGNRVSKNIALLQAGDNGIKTVSGQLKFYDQGGLNDDYVRGVDGNITFKPATEGKVIKLVIQKMKLSYSDYFYAYNGQTVKTAADFTQKGGLDADEVPLTVLSHASDGSLTVRLKSKSTTSSYSYEGWDIDVIEYTPLPLSLEKITSSSMVPQKAFKGVTDMPMLKVAVTIEGDVGDCALENMTFDTPNMVSKTLVKRHLYYTGTTDAFSSHQEIAQSTSSLFQFTSPVTFKKANTYYFWLTYDVSPTAAIDAIVAAQLKNYTVAGTAIVVTDAAIASTKIQAGFRGDYTVGASSSADYADLTAAILAMKEGVDGPVCFTLEAGTYPRISIPVIPGASAVNTITIKGTGNPDEVKFATTEDADEDAGVLEIAGADYLTIDGISILDVNYGWKAALLIKNKSQHVTIKNSTFTSPKYTGYTTGDMDAIICADGADIAYANNDYLTIDNCTLSGSKYAIKVDGTGYVSLPKQEGAVIRNCQISNFGFGGIYMTKERNYTLENNTIINDGALATNSKCIDAVCMPGAVIRNNILESNVNKYASGIYLRARDDNETLERMRIYNNSINFIQTASGSYAINCTDALHNTDIVYNTVLMCGDAVNSACFWSDIDTSLKSVTVQNNILQNKAGGCAVRLQKESAFTSGKMTFTHNIYYSTSATLSFKAASAAYATFEAWTTVSNDTGSQFAATSFLSDKVLDLMERESLITATSLAYVGTDINGLSREDHPTPGAYQFNTAANVAPVMVDGYPLLTNINATEAVVKVKANNNGEAYVLVQEAVEIAPTVATLLANGQKVELKKNAEASCKVIGLTAQHTYKAYIVLVSLRQKQSSIIVSNPFVTSIQPTAVSTFEKVENTLTHFISGTAQFDNFSIVDRTDAGNNNTKAAQIGEEATITLTNSSAGLLLTGFYLKSTTPVTFTAYENESDAAPSIKTIAASDAWTFVNLKDLGRLYKLEVALTGQGEAFIDDFSGEPQALTAFAADVEAQEGEDSTLSTVVSGGVMPYTYQWTNAKHKDLGTLITCTLTAQSTATYYLTVRDAWGNEVETKAVLRVTGNMHVADFENLYLEDESYWGGDFEKTNQFMINSLFYSGSFAFKNYCLPAMRTWAFFGYSNETNTDFTSAEFFTEQFRSSVGHGARSSSNYGIVYCEKTMGHTDMLITNTDQGNVISGMYVSANAYLKYCVLNGDGMSKESDGTTGKPFAIGDSVAIKAVGYLNGEEVAVTSFPLADYRSDNVSDHYILDTWQWMDLSVLGQIDKVRFSMTSTKQNVKGITTPAYFCIDNVGGMRPERLLEKKKLDNTVVIFNLAQLCPTTGAGTTTYHLVSTGESNVATATLENTSLRVETKAIGETSILVLALHCGQRIYYRIPIETTATVGVEDVITQSFIQKTKDKVQFVTSSADYNLTLMSTTGQVIWKSTHLQGTVDLPIGGGLHGIYLLRIQEKGRQEVFKFNY